MELDEKLIFVSVISPEKVLYEGNARSVTLPGHKGSFTVLPNHVNIVSLLEPGILTIKHGEEEITYIIDGGFVEVGKNHVNALIEGTIDVSSVNIEAETKAIQSILTSVVLQEKKSQTDRTLAIHRLRISSAQQKH